MIYDHAWDQQQAAKWAHELLQKDDWLILDTETTGLGGYAEACEISLINHAGRPVLSTLVKPIHPIPDDAIAIHGITNEMVETAPTFPEIYPLLVRAIANKTIVIYNKDFDRRILTTCCQLSQLDNLWNDSTLVCAMKWYSQWYGEWNGRHGNYRWQRLPGGDHTALGDCRATHKVIQRMAETCKREPLPEEVIQMVSVSPPETSAPSNSEPDYDDIPF
jgi:DNA polymerase-3 subunit epsilon